MFSFIRHTDKLTKHTKENKCDPYTGFPDVGLT